MNYYPDQDLLARSECSAAKAQFRRFAFVQSGWHAEIVDRGREGFLAEMERGGVPRTSVDLYAVPGAFEIPLHVKTLALTGRYAAIVACGFVVDGGIYRHEFVAQTVVSALMDIQLETDVPVLSVVLTPHHFHDHPEHRAFFQEHFVVKGTEAAAACVETSAALARLFDATSERAPPLPGLMARTPKAFG